jgi:hypothetical protein
MSSNQIPGVPEGWELVRIGHPVIGVDCVIDYNGDVVVFRGNPNVNSGANWPIIRKIEKPAKYRPFANAEEFKPHRDRWICRLYNGRPDAKGCYRVSAYDDRGVFANDGKTSYQDMLEEGRVFDDGTPFGVKIDE